MFGTKHIILLACSIGLIIGLFYLTYKWSFKAKCRGLMIVGIISEVVKIFFYIIANEDTHGGILPKSDLPFQLCSLQIIFAIILVFTKNEKVKNALTAFMMPSALIGGAMAMIIPTYSALNHWVITFQYFIFHSALVTFSLHLIFSKEKKLTIKDYYTSLIFLLALMFFSIYINSIVYDGVNEVNFMYVVSPPASGLPILNEDHGWFVYVVHYAIIAVLAVSICYIKPIILTLKDFFTKKESEKVTTEKAEVKSTSSDVKEEPKTK